MSRNWNRFSTCLLVFRRNGFVELILIDVFKPLWYLCKIQIVCFIVHSMCIVNCVHSYRTRNRIKNFSFWIFFWWFVDYEYEYNCDWFDVHAFLQGSWLQWLIGVDFISMILKDLHIFSFQRNVINMNGRNEMYAI